MLYKIKLCKENHRVQSKILDISFSTEFGFETNIGCFVTRFCIFAHIYLIIPALLWKGSHIQMMLMNVFNSPFFFFFLSTLMYFLLIFCFKFCYHILPIIVNHLYISFLHSLKTNTRCFRKNEKQPTVISS